MKLIAWVLLEEVEQRKGKWKLGASHPRGNPPGMDTAIFLFLIFHYSPQFAVDFSALC